MVEYKSFWVVSEIIREIEKNLSDMLDMGFQGTQLMKRKR